MNENKGSAVRILIWDNEIPAVCSVEPLDCLSKEGIAAFAVLSGGDHLRHYCEYLKARGYAGDAYADFRDRDGAKEHVRWAVNACRKFVNDESDLRDYMRNPDKPLGIPPSALPPSNSALCVTRHG